MDQQTLSRIISGRLEDVVWESFSDADWKLLEYAAQREGVAPLVYWAFTRAEKFAYLPQAMRNFLHASYVSTRFQNEKNFEELGVLSQLFAQAEIPIVALKGVCFALTIYPDVGLRPMGDIDVLIPSSRLTDAVQIAKTLGYTDGKPEVAPGLRNLLNHEVCLQKTGLLSTTLELHKGLVASKAFSYAVPVNWFWTQTEPLADATQTRFQNLLMLTPVAQVLYAAVHAVLQHGGQHTPLCWYYDLDQLMRHYDERMDWELLLSQAKTFEWGTALGTALSMTCSYFETPIPDGVRTSLLKHTDRHQQLVAFKQTHFTTHILEELQTLMSLSWYGRFRLVLGLIAPSPAYMRWRYRLKHAWTVPVYYPIRWWGILKDAVRTLILLSKNLLSGVICA